MVRHQELGRGVVGDDRAGEAELAAQEIVEDRLRPAAREPVDRRVRIHHRRQARPRRSRRGTARPPPRAARGARAAPARGSGRPPRARSRGSACRSRRRAVREVVPARRARRRRRAAAARYADSPYVSSTRPQRGSRATSSTGASVWRAPVATICSRITAPMRSMRSGSHVDARPIACGNCVASRAHRPAVLSSWTIAGIPSRVSLHEVALDRVRELGALARAQPGRRADARDLADAVRERAGPRPHRRTPSVDDERGAPHATELRELLVQRHARQDRVDVDHGRHARGEPRNPASLRHAVAMRHESTPGRSGRLLLEDRLRRRC